MDLVDALLFFADGLAAASGGFNAAWLMTAAGESRPSRRAAAISLAMMNAGAAVQALYAQAMFSSHRLEVSVEPFFEPGVWLGSRLLLLAGTLAITALILRRGDR